MKSLTRLIRPGSYWDVVLSGSRSYRRAVGGTWYCYENCASGWGSGSCWVRERLPEDHWIVETGIETRPVASQSTSQD